MSNVAVFLAPLDSTDMALVRTWRNNHKIWQWCRQHDLISDAEQFEWYQRQSRDPSVKMYKVMVSAGEKTGPVGVCGLTSLDYVNRRAEFSLYIAPEAQGRGLGKMALSILLDHGFRNFGLHQIWGETFGGNPAAKMFESLGFKKDGTRRQFYFRDGRFIDAHLYSILAEEFYARASSPEPAPAPRPDPAPLVPGETKVIREDIKLSSVPDAAGGEEKADLAQ